MKYITNPPTVLDVPLPPFLAKRFNLFDEKFIEKLIAWSKKEYFDMIMLMYSSGKSGVAKKLETEYSFINFLANCRSFSVIEKNMNETVWSSLDRETKKILISAKEAMIRKS